ncbi:MULTISPECIES: anti-sigma factor domain-containing protein [unclassified Streptomyces]|uniref:anti-sigma factor n=1 Tax=unclassified Streptomyces TaxID=2593676 RepID=UPI0016555A35|nr:anti-sigma factor [Streptomyces sp. CB02980]MCB8901714.1 anti-sigma factor [Streptomyces sp. CB02980]
MNAVDPHTMTGAYALDALDPEEQEAVRRHLAVCPSCTEEVREFSETAVRLGLAVAVTPTATLRTGVLERIATVRQEPPATPRAARTPRGLRRWSQWALAACLAGAVGLGGVAAWQHGLAEDARKETARAQAANDAVAEVLAAPDARVSTSRLEGGAVGTVVVSASLDRAVFAASGMAPPPAGKVYQLWYDDGGTMRSAGLMDPGATAEATLLDGPVNQASGVGVTVEPAGGSPSPTSAPVAVLAFPRA